MDSGDELPCEYISCSFEWVDSLAVKVVGQLKGEGGRLDVTPVQQDEISFWSGF